MLTTERPKIFINLSISSPIISYFIREGGFSVTPLSSERIHPAGRLKSVPLIGFPLQNVDHLRRHVLECFSVALTHRLDVKVQLL